jgi:TPR repeat protein
MARRSDVAARAEQLRERGQARAAFGALLRAARRGDSSVYVNLGYAYDVGLGVRKSKRKAVRWYGRAAKRGEAHAANNIGTVYRDRGNLARSLMWFGQAVRMGASGSNVAIGQLLLSGLGQPEEALACFHAVGDDACEADVEAARAWAATVENMIATREPRGGPTRR